MFCVHCGSPLPNEAYFCNSCGKSQNTATNMSLLSTNNVTQEERNSAIAKRLLPFGTPAKSSARASSTHAVLASPTLETTPTATPTAKKGSSQPIGTLFYTYHGHSDFVTWAVWSLDGKRIVSCSLDKTAQVWDATTGKNVITYQKHTDALYVVT